MNNDDEQAVLSALKALAGETAGLEAPPAVEQAVLRAFRARQVRRARRNWLWIPGAVAAGLALFAWLGTGPREILPMPGLGAALRFSPAVVEAPVARPAPKTVAKRRRPVSAEQPPTEVATDFLPMQPGPILSRDEALQLVRITLPRTEMLRFGLPVAPGPRGARVMADVVLGEDGIARAIRFVR